MHVFYFFRQTFIFCLYREIFKRFVSRELVSGVAESIVEFF